MFKKAIIAVLVLTFMLTGCKSEDVNLQSISDYYEDIHSLTLEAAVTTNSGVMICYDILFTRNTEGDSVTILSPESLAGITAKVYTDKAEIIYDDLAVETLLPGISGYVPADAVSGILKDLGSSVPEEYSVVDIDGRSAIVLSYCGEYEGLSCEKTIWLDKDTMTILKGEFYLDGLMTMELTVSLFIV